MTCSSVLLLPQAVRLTLRPCARAGAKKQHQDSLSPAPRLVASRPAAPGTRSPSTGTVRFLRRAHHLSGHVVVPSSASSASSPRSRRLPNPKQNTVPQPASLRCPRRRRPLAEAAARATSSAAAGAMRMRRWTSAKLVASRLISKEAFERADKND